MARVRSRNTAPEVALRKALWALGKRYQLHAPIPGRPDIVFAGHRVAVFVDGCFWHGCPVHFIPPRNNAEWWQQKIANTVARDRTTRRALEDLGWLVMSFWEHEPPVEVARRISTAVISRRPATPP